MPDRSARMAADPLVVALRMALHEIAERRAADRAERRRTIEVIDGAKRRGGEAA